MLESHTPKEMYEKKLFSPYMSDIPIMEFTRHGKMCHFSTLPRGNFYGPLVRVTAFVGYSKLSLADCQVSPVVATSLISNMKSSISITCSDDLVLCKAKNLLLIVVARSPGTSRKEVFSATWTVLVVPIHNRQLIGGCWRLLCRLIM
jgi:hypothetical protein